MMPVEQEVATAMQTERSIDFWFSLGSTYTYLTVMRLDDVSRRSAVRFRWRPFDLLAILKEMKHVPFADKPQKAAYMWRDIERRAAYHRIPVKVPAPYPLKQSIIANRIARLGLNEGWGRNFIRAAYRRWMIEGQEMGGDTNTRACLREIGEDEARVLAEADSERTCIELADETSTARELGIFGSPTFAIGRELFWGDDKLEDAVVWVQQNGKPASQRCA